jgi:predicted ArsR family transcriptional regulator
VQVLAEPTRRAVFDAVRAARQPVTRDDVATAVGLQRPLAAFHLDRLAEAGLLHVSYARPPDRTGRGAGRPAKRYDATGVAVSVAVPGRRHDLVGRLLARAIAEKPANAEEHLRALAEREGQRLGERHRSGRRSSEATLRNAAVALTELGYEPVREGPTLRLRNCPFHGVVEAAPELVCAMNHRLVTGLVDGLGGGRQIDVTLAPVPGECCVSVAKRNARKLRS